MFFAEEAAAIAGKFGSIVKDAVSAFKADPTKALELEATLEQARIDFSLQLEKLVAEKERVAKEDRDSARQREMAVQDSTPRTLAYVVVGGFLGMSFAQLWALYYFNEINLRPEAWVVIGNLSGYMAAKSELALAYYFGSSAGSSQKNDIIKSLRKD